MASALQGVRVLEIGGTADFAVAYAGLLLADLGADVILLEDLDGHPLRRGHPSAPGNPEINAALFCFLTTGKRIMACDLSRADNQVINALLPATDIILTTFTPQELLNRAPLLPLDRAIAIVHVTPWGGTGPYRDRPATSLVVQAAAGWVTSRKEVAMEPVQVGGHMHEWSTGPFISTAALTAYRQARLTSMAVSVDFSEFEAVHSMLCYDRLRYDARGELGVPRDRILISPFGIRRCADGWVGINTLTQQQWTDACAMTGLDVFVDDQQAMNRGEGPLDDFGARVDAFLADKRVHELVELGQRHRIPVIPVTDGAQMLDLEQWKVRPFFREVEIEGRSLQVPGPPWRLSSTPARAGADSSVGEQR